MTENTLFSKKPEKLAISFWIWGLWGDVYNNYDLRMKELKELIRYGEWYRDAQPVLREICSTKNVKRKTAIKSENDQLLRRYHIAKRVLFEEKQIDKVDVSRWKKELTSIQDSYQEEYAAYKELSAETKTMRDINRYIDDAIRSTNPRKKEEPIR